MKIAIVGATGLVGQKFLEILEEKNLRAEYVLFSSKRSAGKKIKVFDQILEVKDLSLYETEKFDYALFSAGGAVSLEYAPKFAENGAIVIDNSSAFRMNEDVPLVVPEVNIVEALITEGKIIANPNCSTIQLVQVLKKIDTLSEIKRVVVSTYQSVSGAGVEAMEELKNNSKKYLDNKFEEDKKFPQGIAFNCIPQIDVAMDNGYTKEEMKMIEETSKIMGKKIPLTATCVRVPVFNCHSESVNIELSDKVSLDEIKSYLAKDSNIKVLDDLSNGVFPTNKDGAGKNETFVGRIREDRSKENTINLWIVSDNIRKGAALNAVQILEKIISHKNQ